VSADEPVQDAAPGLDDLRQWRAEVAETSASQAQDVASGKSVAYAHRLGEWDPATIADRPEGAPPDSGGLPPDDATPPPGASLGEHIRDFFRLERDGAMVLARAEDRRGLLPETIFVLGVSLGASAIWSILSMVNSLTLGPPLANQTTSMNNSVTPDRPWLDLLYQLYNIIIPLVPVAIAFYLLSRVRRPDGAPFRVMGIKWANAPRDAALGVALAAAIGIPGLGLYVAARALGLELNVSPANLAAFWWTIPVYVLLAAMNGILEETVMIGYLFTRWTQIAWAPWRIIVTSALIRGCYHLYQGWGGLVGNAIMGVAFGWLYMRTKRVLPLIIAHTILDIVSFVGYALLHNIWSWL